MPLERSGCHLPPVVPLPQPESSLCQEGNFRDFWARRVHVPSKAQLPKVLVGPGVTSPKSRPPGCRAGHAGYESFPLVLPGPLLLCVDEELPIDGVTDVTLEGADRLPLGLAFRHLPLEVDPALRVLLADLADGHHVDGVVELAVASPAQPMDDPATGGQLDWGHSGIGGELVPGGEPTDVSGVADQLAGQDRTDAIEPCQRGPRSLNGRLDPFVGLLQLHVESLHVVE